MGDVYKGTSTVWYGPTGAYINDAVGCAIDNCFIDDLYSCGVIIETSSEYSGTGDIWTEYMNYSRDNVISNIRGGNNQVLIYIEDTVNTQITDCTSWDNTRNEAYSGSEHTPGDAQSP